MAYLLGFSLVSLFCLYAVYQYKGRKNHLGLYIAIMIGVLALLSPFILYAPQISGDERIFIKDDTLFINGPYSKAIPRREIASLQTVDSLPDIDLRTDGISFENIDIGHFRTEDNEDILLYLNSSSTKFYFVQTTKGEKIYLNFKDSSKVLRFDK